jgi:hypothetical protein
VNSILKHGDVEVNEQTDSPSTKPQIGQQLGIVHRCKQVNRFNFNNNITRDEKIEPVATLKVNSFVSEWNWLLAFEGNASQNEFPVPGIRDTPTPAGPDLIDGGPQSPRR